MRVRPGTPVERLRSGLASSLARLGNENPSFFGGRIFTERSLVNAIIGDLGSALLIVLAASLLLLLLACVNVTNLLLARGSVRSREIAVRVALGAGRARIVRQLLTESLVLATAGSVAGLAVAVILVKLLLLYGASTLPRLDNVVFDSTVLLFAFGGLLGVTVLIGLAPIVRFAVSDVKSLISENNRSTTGGRAQRRMLSATTVAEIALAITLVAGAGWLLRSFANLQRIDPGFLTNGRLSLDLSVPGSKYRWPDGMAAWNRNLTDRLGSIGGVTGVGSASTFPSSPSTRSSTASASSEKQMIRIIHGQPGSAP